MTAIYIQTNKLQKKLWFVDIFVFLFGWCPVTTCNTLLSSSASPSFRDSATSILSDARRHHLQFLSEMADLSGSRHANTGATAI